MFSDGVSFGAQDVTDHAELWNGLIVDSSEVTAEVAGSQGGRRITRTMMGLPQTLTYAESDFLPGVTTNTSRGRLDPLTFDWQAASVGDVLVVNATWQNKAVGVRKPVVWKAVLPPDATSVTFPSFDDALAAATSRPDILLRYVDSDRYDGFEALLSSRR